MHVLAIDTVHISFVDVNFTLGAEKSIILPTYALDSHFQNINETIQNKCFIFNATEGEWNNKIADMHKQNWVIDNSLMMNANFIYNTRLLR